MRNRGRRYTARWRRGERWVSMAAGVGALLLAYAGWQVFRWPSDHRTLVGDIFFYPMGLAAIGAALGASRRCADQPRLRVAWRLLAVASASYLAGDIAQTIYELSGSRPYPSVGDALYLAFYPLMLCGLLHFTSGARTAADRVRLGLDLGVVAIGGADVVMYVVLGPTVVRAGSESLQTAFSIAYPVGDMVLLVGLASVLLRQGSASSARALHFLAAGLVFYVAADLIYGYITLHSTYHGGDPVDSLWMVAIALFAVAGAAQMTATTQTKPSVEAARRASWAPYVAVAVGFGLLIIEERHVRLMPDFSLVLAAVLLAILVSVRQFLLQRELLETRQRLSYQSLHDGLTGLPNRSLVMDRAEHLLARARRDHIPVAALYVDVDGFKTINDTYGHAAGDALLGIVAKRISGVLRESDTVGRIGGDEFIVLLAEHGLDDGPALVAQRICDAVGRPVELDGNEGCPISVTASIGIAAGQRRSADALFRDADEALYRAKAEGRNRWAEFS